MRNSIASLILELAKKRAIEAEAEVSPKTRQIELREQARKILSDGK